MHEGCCAVSYPPISSLNMVLTITSKQTKLVHHRTFGEHPDAEYISLIAKLRVLVVISDWACRLVVVFLCSASGSLTRSQPQVSVRHLLISPLIDN
jgi:hypothetical protein